MNFPAASTVDWEIPPQNRKQHQSCTPDGVFEPQYQREMYSLFFDSAPDPVMAIDHEGRILRANSQATRQFGYSHEELLGEPVYTLIPGCDSIAFGRHCEVHRNPGFRPMNGGVVMLALRKDGKEFCVHVHLGPVLTKSGVVYFAIVRNLGDREAALRARRHLEFEQTVAGLSAKFINLSPECVDKEITSGLEVLCDALGTDRANFGLIEPATGDILCTHQWTREGIPPFGQRLLKGFLPWLEHLITRGETVLCERPSDLPPEASREREYMEAIGLKSSLVVSFRVAGRLAGGMGTGSFRNHYHWDRPIISRVQDVAHMFANAVERKRAAEDLRSALAEVSQLKNKLERENIYLREEIKLEFSHSKIVGDSAAIRAVLKKAELVSETDSAVLILGETGTGKELISRTIHDLSRRKNHHMVKVNCAALPSTLIESELFGREKGAFTGALSREIGRFELADNSTIFLDEIGELPVDLQSKLLRVLQEGEFERLGSSRTMRVDVRVIAATSRNLSGMVKEGKFREDLFYRLNVFPICVPPLRERLEDIPALVWHVLEDLGRRMGRKIEGVDANTMRAFQTYSWPGNARELRNVIERNLILNRGLIFRAELSELGLDNRGGLRRLNEVEREYLGHVLDSTQWRVRGHGGAADVTGLKATTLEARMKKLGIRRPR
ncbi:MAG: sigma 54-interacting transcriptional regulator [Acidobacteriaceae bacterium]|nr:sigma 54-interacting transcriptional regulator [Acidobacteriaceae bacterium]